MSQPDSEKDVVEDKAVESLKSYMIHKLEI